jgi:DSP-PTPase phosphatase fused to NAD+ Kinase
MTRSTRRAFVAGLSTMPFTQFRAIAQGTTRPSAWATPVVLEGAPNLHHVEKNFFRSAQPDAAGFRGLATTYGVRTVVSLRAFNSDEPLARGLGLTLERFRINTWNIKRKDVVAALQTLRRASREAPALLHCQHGADRTGMIAALYRILYQGWGKAAALDEMQNGKFGYHAVWGNIPRFIRRVDAERLRRDVGVS